MNKNKKICYQEEMSFSYEKQPEVELIHVIKTRLKKTGEGTEQDPIRIVEQYWMPDGELLWEKDTLKKRGRGEKQEKEKKKG